MDHRYIEENNLVERYVLGRLPVDEQIRFEEHFAECEACVTELELADVFGETLRATAADDARRMVGLGGLAVLASRFRGPRAAWLLGLLALVVVFPSLWLVSENRRLSDHLASLRQPLASIPSLLLTTVRDAEGPQVPVLTPSADQAWVALMVEVGEDVDRVDAVLSDAEGIVRWHGEDLEPNLWSVLQLTFPVELLSPGEYHLDLQRRGVEGESELLGSFPFRLAAP